VHDEPTYHILPTNSGWRVLLNNDVLKVFADQASALRYLKRIAHMAGDAHVVVHSHADDYGEEIALHRGQEGAVETIYQIPRTR
jgi:hypothetical protein